MGELLTQIEGWFVDEYKLKDDDALWLRLRSWRNKGDVVEIIVTKRGKVPRPHRVLEHCQVHYTTNLNRIDNSTREQLGRFIRSLSESLDALLAAAPGATLAAALGRDTSRKRLEISKQTLVDLLAPQILPGTPFAGGWRLVDVRPSTLRQVSADDAIEWIVAFDHPEDRESAFFVLTPREASPTASMCTAHFAIRSLEGRGVDSRSYQALRSFFVFQLGLKDRPEMEVEFPRGSSVPEPAALVQIASSAPDTRPVMLSISSECGQSCVFCSFKEAFPVMDGGRAHLARYAEELAAGARRGAKQCVFNGVDPLTFSGIIELAQVANDLDFDSCVLYSPCTRLADEAFCTSLVDALPGNTRFVVPLYGLDSAVHDAVVAADGAHAKVMQALKHLRANAGVKDVWLTTVLTRTNESAIPELLAFARREGYRLIVQQPYPNADLHTDRFYEITLRQSRAMELLGTQSPRDGGEAARLFDGVAPCVVFKQMREVGGRPRNWFAVDHKAGGSGMPGSMRVPCPKAEDCILAAACSKSVLRSYVAMYGWDEFEAVTMRQWIDLFDPPGA